MAVNRDGQCLRVDVAEKGPGHSNCAVVPQPGNHVSVVEGKGFFNTDLPGFFGCTELLQFLLFRVEGIQVFLCIFFRLFP